MHCDYRWCKFILPLLRAAAVYRYRTGKTCITDLIANAAGRLLCTKVLMLFCVSSSQAPHSWCHPAEVICTGMDMQQMQL